MITADPSLLWEREAVSLHDQFASRGVVDPETGERFTVRRIDDAIQSAVEAVNGREGTQIIDVFGRTWWMLRDDIARFLGVDYDEIAEVTP